MHWPVYKNNTDINLYYEGRVNCQLVFRKRPVMIWRRCRHAGAAALRNIALYVVSRTTRGVARTEGMGLLADCLSIWVVSFGTGVVGEVRDFCTL